MQGEIIPFPKFSKDSKPSLLLLHLICHAIYGKYNLLILMDYLHFRQGMSVGYIWEDRQKTAQKLKFLPLLSN